jgi:YD repeat-containing protein
VSSRINYPISLSFTDQLGRRSTSIFDAAGRLQASVDALGNRVTQTYDAASRTMRVQEEKKGRRKRGQVRFFRLASASVVGRGALHRLRISIRA